jgi:hypothetical protein
MSETKSNHFWLFLFSSIRVAVGMGIVYLEIVSTSSKPHLGVEFVLVFLGVIVISWGEFFLFKDLSRLDALFFALDSTHMLTDRL